MSEVLKHDVISADLRLRRRRADAELVLMRAEHLPPADAEFIRAIFSQGLTATRVAALQGADPRLVRRRARAILRRMNEPIFMYVARERGGWSTVRRRIAESGVLAGRGLRAIAAETGLSIHLVRRHMEAIRAMSESSRRPAQPWRAPLPEVRP